MAAGAQKIAITGSTGLVGTALCPFLAAGGHTVTRLVRSTGKPFSWDASRGLDDPASLEGIDAVASYAGGETLRARRQALAAREGALIPLIPEPGQAERYALERHVCVDTTAAGGNAALLADAGAA